MQIRLGNALPLHILLDMYISTCDTFTRWEVRLVLFPGRGTPIQLTSYFSTGDPYVYKSSKDRSSLCAFTYADGGHCRMPRNFADYRYCSDHELKICRFVHDEVALESSSSCLMAPFPFPASLSLSRTCLLPSPQPHRSQNRRRSRPHRGNSSQNHSGFHQRILLRLPWRQPRRTSPPPPAPLTTSLSPPVDPSSPHPSDPSKPRS